MKNNSGRMKSNSGWLTLSSIVYLLFLGTAFYYAIKQEWLPAIFWAVMTLEQQVQNNFARSKDD